MDMLRTRGMRRPWYGPVEGSMLDRSEGHFQMAGRASNSRGGFFDILFDIPVRGIGGVEVHVAEDPGVGVGAGITGVRAGEEEPALVVVVVHPPGEQELAVIVHAEDGLSLGFGPAERGQEEPGEDGDDGDDDEQFDQGESPLTGIAPAAQPDCESISNCQFQTRPI
jgi:hypothetical protein